MSSTQGNDSEDAQRSGVARLFDVRLVIGGLLAVYGVILTIKGIVDNSAAVKKSFGIRINLWTGLALLVVGAFFLIWMKLAPVQAVKSDEADDTSPSDRR